MKYICFLILVFATATAFAQRDSLPSDELQIIKDFDAQVDDFDKVDVSAPLPTLDTTRYVSNYNIKPKFLTLSYDAPKIKPILLKPTSNIQDYAGFLKLGAAYPLAPYVEAGYQKQADALNYGGKLRYFGTFDWKQLEHQKFMDGDVSINAKYQFEEGFALGGDIGYEYDRRYFYGYDHDAISFKAQDIRQHFSTLKNHLSFENTDEGSLLDYHIKTGLYYLRDNYNTKELGIRADAFLGTSIAEKHQLGLKIRNEWIKNDADTTTHLNVLSLTPSFTFRHNVFRLQAGVNTSLLHKKFKIFPDAEAVAKVYEDKVAVFAGWKGYATPHSFRKITQYLPYIVSNPALSYQEVNYPYLGVKVNFPPFNASLKGGYKMVKNQAFYVNNYTSTINRFNVQYDDVNYITATLQTAVKILPDFGIDLGVNYQKAKLDSLVTNSHDVANVDISTTLSYAGLLNKKLKIGTTLFFNSGKPFITATGSADHLKSYFDANVFVKYAINKQFSTFLHLNNVTNQKYQDWNGYQNYGFNALVGVFWKWE